MSSKPLHGNSQADFPTRFRRFKQLTGLSTRQIAEQISTPADILTSWENGVLPRGIALLRLMSLASRIPDGVDTLFPLLAADIHELESRHKPYE